MHVFKCFQNCIASQLRIAELYSSYLQLQPQLQLHRRTYHIESLLNCMHSYTYTHSYSYRQLQLQIAIAVFYCNHALLQSSSVQNLPSCCTCILNISSEARAHSYIKNSCSKACLYVCRHVMLQNLTSSHHYTLAASYG